MTPEATRALIARLRRMADATRNGKMVLLPEGAVSRLDLMERRLIAAVNRALTPGPERDGFPGGHPGMGGEDAPQSSTEGAALARLKGAPKDPMSDAALRAFRHLETAVNELAGLMLQLDHIDEALSTPYRHANMPAACLACDRMVEGTANDRLRRGLCEADYKAWARSGKPDIMQFRRTRAGEAA